MGNKKVSTDEKQWNTVDGFLFCVCVCVYISISILF